MGPVRHVSIESATVETSLSDKESAALALSALFSGRKLLSKFETLPDSDNEQPELDPDLVSSTNTITTDNSNGDQRAVSPNSVVTFNDSASIDLDTDISITDNNDHNNNNNTIQTPPSSKANFSSTAIPIYADGEESKQENETLKRKSLSTPSSSPDPAAMVSPNIKLNKNKNKNKNKRVKTETETETETETKIDTHTETKQMDDKADNNEEMTSITTQLLKSQETLISSPAVNNMSTPSSCANPVLKGNAIAATIAGTCVGNNKLWTPPYHFRTKPLPYALQHHHYPPINHHSIPHPPQNNHGHFITPSSNTSAAVTTPYPIANYRKHCPQQEKNRHKTDGQQQQQQQGCQPIGLTPSFIRYNGAYTCHSNDNRNITPVNTTATKNSLKALAHVTPSPHRNDSSAGIIINTSKTSRSSTPTPGAGVGAGPMFCRPPNLTTTPSCGKYPSSQPSPHQLSGTLSGMHRQYVVSSAVKHIGCTSSHNLVTPTTLLSGTCNNRTQLGITNHCTSHPPTTPTTPIATTPNNTSSNLSNNGNYSRKDKSLGVLCENFMRKYASLSTHNNCFTSPPPNNAKHPHHKIGIPTALLPPPAISIDVAAKSLRVERRRIYDIINILEAIRVVSRKCKNTYYWHGTEGLLHTFQCMQKDAIEMWREDAVQNGLLEENVDVQKGVGNIGGIGGEEDGLGVQVPPMSESKTEKQQVDVPQAQPQQDSNTTPKTAATTTTAPLKSPTPPSGLAMLLASAEHVEVGTTTMKTTTKTKYSSLNSDAKNLKSATITTTTTTVTTTTIPTTIPTITSTIPTTKAKQKPKEKSLGKLSQKFIQLFLVGHTVIALTDASDKILGPTKPVIPCKGATKAEESVARAKASRSLKTKIRRLYDIANVLVSIGLIEKLNGGNNMSNSLKHRPSFRWVYGVSPRALLERSRSMAFSSQMKRRNVDTFRKEDNSTHNKENNSKHGGDCCEL